MLQDYFHFRICILDLEKIIIKESQVFKMKLQNLKIFDATQTEHQKIRNKNTFIFLAVLSFL